MRFLPPMTRGEASGVLLFFLIFCGAAAATWRRSGDPVVDWGRELLVAWSVADGRGVPPDASYLFGPLSPGVNGSLMRLFGNVATPILAANLAILLVAALCVWKLGETLFSRSTATLGLGAFLTLSGFAHWTRYGSFNFLTPYSHGVTHGLTLGLLLLLTVTARVDRRRERFRSCVVGVLCALAILTKPEFGVAAVAAVALALAVPDSFPERSRSLSPAYVIGGILLGLGAVGLAVAPASSPRELWHSLFRNYLSAMSFEARSLEFYRRSLGLDRPAEHIAVMATVLISLTTLFATLVIARRRRPTAGGDGGSRVRKLRHAGLLVLLVIASLALFPTAWTRLARPLPIVVLGVLFGHALPSLRRSAHSSSDCARRARAQVIVCGFSLALLLKLGLYPRFEFYGFALSAPAVLVSVGALNDLLPGVIGRRYGVEYPMRVVGRGLVLYVCVMSGILSVWAFTARDYPIGSGGNRLYLLPPSVDSRTGPFAATLARLATDSSAHGDFAVLPEGALLHFLLRSPPGHGYASLMPLEVALMGPETVAQRLRATAPPLIVLVEGALEAYGVAFPPGTLEYEPLMAWTRSRYCLEETVGAEAGSKGAIVFQFWLPCEVE